MARISVEHLKAGYGSTVILHDVSFNVEEGEIRVILAESGGGKSTLLNHIIGLEKPMSGKITLLDEVVTANPDGFTPGLRKKTAVMFQGSALLSSMSVFENVSLPLRLANPDLPKSILEEVVYNKLCLVHLEQAFYKMPSELSGGMKKRAALARAIVTDPLLLFCDEPSAGLDPITSRNLDDLLMELRDKLGLSLIIVTHELDSIRAIANKILFLSKGYVIFDGTLDEAVTKGPPSVRNFFARAPTPGEDKSQLLHFNLEG